MSDRLEIRLWNSNEDLKLSIHEDRLLFIHSSFLSSQWALSNIGVQIFHQGDNVKFSIMSNIRNDEACQGWFIEPKHFEELVIYFRLLGYPVPDPDPFGHYDPKSHNKE